MQTFVMAYRRNEPQKSLFTMYRGFALGTLAFALIFAFIAEDGIVPGIEKDRDPAPEETEPALHSRKVDKGEQASVAGFFEEDPSEDFDDESGEGLEESPDHIGIQVDETGENPVTDPDAEPQPESADATLP